tara:strand:- start:1844 stop:2980 length:1137 start_codon:yes stop_codon:yes gene_type:complete
MKKMSKEKKGQRRFKVGGNGGIQRASIEKLQSMYEKWKTECNASGKAIGVKNDMTLLDIISNHGVVSRPYTKKTVPKEKGAGTIIDMFEEWINDAVIIEKADVIALRQVIKKLNEMRDSDTDPRNIKFTVPIAEQVDTESGVYDDDDVQEVYGHYMTPDYVKFRNILAELPNSKVKKETDPVDSTWFEESALGSGAGKNKAKPPMWQALFADGGTKPVSSGLYKICEEAAKVIKDAKIEEVIITVDDDNKGALAEDLMKIPSVKRWVNSMVGTRTKIGPGINPKTLHWKGRPMQEAFNRETFDLTDSESETLKRAADIDDIIGTITSVKFKISIRQVRKLASLTKNAEKIQGRDVVRHISKPVKKSEELSWEKMIGFQ